MEPIQKPFLSRAWSALRSNWLPILIFFALGAALLFGKPVLLAITSYVHGVDPQAVADKLPANMSGAEVAADKEASGWLPAGLGSKFLFSAGYFFLFVFLVWIAQSIAEPRGKAWVKTEAKTDAEALTVAEKFREYRAGRWQLILLAVASMIAGAYIL